MLLWDFAYLTTCCQRNIWGRGVYITSRPNLRPQQWAFSMAPGRFFAFLSLHFFSTKNISHSHIAYILNVLTCRVQSILHSRIHSRINSKFENASGNEVDKVQFRNNRFKCHLFVIGVNWSNYQVISRLRARNT